MSKEKQIEEMAKVIADKRGYGCNEKDHCDMSCAVFKVGCIPYEDAEVLCDAGYRKQSEGEWVFEFTLDDDDFYRCSVCDRQEVINGLCKERSPAEHLPYCHCGAKMRKEDEGK